MWAEPIVDGQKGGVRGLTWGALGAPHSHAAAVASDAVVGDLGDDVRVGLQVEQQDVVGLQVPVDDHGRVKVPEHGACKHKPSTRFYHNRNRDFFVHRVPT